MHANRPNAICVTGTMHGILLQAQKVNEPPFTFHEAITLFWHTVRDFAKGFAAHLPYLIVGVLVFVAFWLLSGLVQKIIVRVANKSNAIDGTLADLISRLSGGLVTIAGFLAACVIILPSFKPADIFTGLGISSVAIGFAFKDILQNFFAGVLLLWRRPFAIGDQIRVKEFEGTVEEINLRSTRLKTYDGERVILPNGDVYTSSIVVRTAYPKRRVKIDITIGYRDPIERSRTAIYDVLNGIDGVLKDPGPWVYVSDLGPSYIVLSVFFWTDSHQANVLKVSDEVITKIQIALNETGVDLPYPHSVVILQNRPEPQVAMMRPSKPA